MIKQPEKIEIYTDFIKLDSLLKLAGIAETGGDAKLMVQDGEVKLNGETCLMRGKKIFPGDKVKVPGREISVTKEARFKVKLIKK